MAAGLLVALLASCSDDSSDKSNGAGASGNDGAGNSGDRVEAGGTGSDSSDAATADAAEWKKVVPGGDCQCADGSAYNFWVHRGDPQKVVVFLQGGGACFTADTCDPKNELYRTTVSEAPHAEGMFDFADQRNPFADHSVVYVPYCTGDVHLGGATKTYAKGLTIQHKGFANGTAALDHLAEAFPGATRVVVAGESAGSVAAPVYGALVADRLPEAAVTVLADGSGSYPDDPAIERLMTDVWDVDEALPAGFDEADLSPPGLFVQSGRRHPEIVFARHDFAYDENQSGWYPYLGIPLGDLVERIDANEAQIEQAGVDLHSYVAPGDEHTVLGDAELYDGEVGGHRLVDWVSGLVEGKTVDDVHCRECRSG